MKRYTFDGMDDLHENENGEYIFYKDLQAEKKTHLEWAKKAIYNLAKELFLPYKDVFPVVYKNINSLDDLKKEDQIRFIRMALEKSNINQNEYFNDIENL